MKNNCCKDNFGSGVICTDVTIIFHNKVNILQNILHRNQKYFKEK